MKYSCASQAAPAHDSANAAHFSAVAIEKYSEFSILWI